MSLVVDALIIRKNNSMEQSFLPFLCDPYDKGHLLYISFECANSNLISGIFINERSRRAYPLFDGVPVFLENAFPQEYLHQFGERLKELHRQYPNLKIVAQKNDHWSFSTEWEEHSVLEMDTTWGMTTQRRYEQALLELQTSEADLLGKYLLDAGCGNGILTEFFATKGAIAFGLDFSTSVFAAEKRRKSDSVCFIRGDLRDCPFPPKMFDIVYSPGVIHHTPNTEETFQRLCRHVKEKGKFYVWLYSRKGNVFWPAKRLFFDVARTFVCRLPDALQKTFVNVFSVVSYPVSFRNVDWKTHKINLYNSISPRWRHYHTPEEVSRWYFEAGFGPIVLTHWDHKYGFGVVATNERMPTTPGMNYCAMPAVEDEAALANR